MAPSLRHLVLAELAVGGPFRLYVLATALDLAPLLKALRWYASSGWMRRELAREWLLARLRWRADGLRATALTFAACGRMLHACALYVPATPCFRAAEGYHRRSAQTARALSAVSRGVIDLLEAQHHA